MIEAFGRSLREQTQNSTWPQTRMLDEDDARTQKSSDGLPSNELAQVDDRNHHVPVLKNPGNILGNLREPPQPNVWQHFQDLRDVEAISLAVHFKEQRYHSFIKPLPVLSWLLAAPAKSLSQCLR